MMFSAVRFALLLFQLTYLKKYKVRFLLMFFVVVE